MAIVQESLSVPMSTMPWHPKPGIYFNDHLAGPLPEWDPTYRGYVVYDNSWTSPPKGVVVYMHGSGGVASTGDMNHALVQALVTSGFAVKTLHRLGNGLSDPSPWLYGYAAVHMAGVLRAWTANASCWVNAALHAHRESRFSTAPWIIFGHSLGAAAALAWSAGYGGVTAFGESRMPSGLGPFRGFVAAGGTSGGLGNGQWNEMPRTINSFGSVLPLVQHRCIMAYASNDLYAPPNMVRRIQALSPSNMAWVNPGPLGHSWSTVVPAGTNAAVHWASQLMDDGPFTNLDGSPTVWGPATTGGVPPIPDPGPGPDPSGGVPEAPADGKLYGRRNEDWDEVSGSGGSDWSTVNW